MRSAELLLILIFGALGYRSCAKCGSSAKPPGAPGKTAC